MTTFFMTDAVPRPAPLPDREFASQVSALAVSMYRYAVSLCADRTLAEDLTQDALAKAWRFRARFVAGTNLKAWTFRILRNAFLSHIRQQKVRRTDTYGDEFPDVAVHAEQESGLLSDDLAAALAMLPDEQRDALLLIARDGLSYEEAARLQNVALGTIKSRVSRGRETVRQIIEGDAIARRPARDRLSGPSVVAGVSGAGAAVAVGPVAARPIAIVPVPTDFRSDRSDGSDVQAALLRNWRAGNKTRG
ncbi:sigma-70 family RNA polymerase sigma factor [Sphingomonas sp. 4RDLI-65]|uniref:sigma-70 family RNA polymerase sigma factor n=1 Tax=Sphingomonas sp. 4RDLI-65 TaxID=3111641 RepID=UPI003C132AE4